MQRYFTKDDKLSLSELDKHHIINVMRMKKNDKIEIVYDEIVYLCNINSISKKDVSYEIIEKLDTNSELSKKVTIAVPLVSEKKLDFIFQKCTELGIHDFIIYKCERSKVRVNEKENRKIERWNLIAKEAAEQSFRNHIPNIYGIKDFDYLSNLDHDLKLVSSTKKVKKSIKNVLQNSTNYDRIIIVVGPEGGLTDSEENELLCSGYEAVTFGSAILRCETAPMFIMSAIKYELGE